MIDAWNLVWIIPVVASVCFAFGAWLASGKVCDAQAADMDVVIRKLGELPPGQLKKLLTDEELCAVLRKYGVDV